MNYLYISDNNSKDGTRDMIKEFQKEYPFIFYKKQEYNKGIDINMLDVIKMAETKYAWLLGDDDGILNNTIVHILGLLGEDEEYDLLLLNGKLPNGRLTLREVKDSIVRDCREFFKKYCFNMPFGTLIINIENFKEGKDLSRFIGTSHAYSGAVLEYLAERYIKVGENKILIIAKPSVLLAYGTKLKTWEESSAKIMLLEIPEWFIKLHPIYSTEAKKIAATYLKEKSNDILSFFKYRATRNINISNFLFYTKYLSFRGKFYGFICALLPVKFAEEVLCLGKTLRNFIRQIKRDYNQ